MTDFTTHGNSLRDLTDEEWIRFEEIMSTKRWEAAMMLTGVWICEHQSSKKLISGPYMSLRELALDIIHAQTDENMDLQGRQKTPDL